MITIQGFAKLCGCNAQTLRYYDRIGLLTPAKVDQWTGYRYYEESQAMRFVKIKNLQQADFSIEEIRPLLEVDDEHLMEAFERKIEEQTRKLERIRTIQRSYLKETMDMQKMVMSITDLVESRMNDPRLWNEFGLNDAEQAETGARVHEMVADWLARCRNASDEMAQSMDSEKMGTVKKVVDHLTDDGTDMPLPAGGETPAEDAVPAGAEMIFARDGWEHVSEWIDDLPDLGDETQSFFLFRVRDGSPLADTAFPTLMLAVMAVRYNAMNGGMYCNVVRSGDGANHFALYRK